MPDCDAIPLGAWRRSLKRDSNVVTVFCGGATPIDAHRLPGNTPSMASPDFKPLYLHRIPRQTKP